MKILVTGAAGFIGSHFVEAAEFAGHQVAAIDCLSYAGRSRNLGANYRHLSVADICDVVLMEHHFERVRPDAVVHLAAESHVARSIECRDEFLRTNVAGTQVLLEVAQGWWESLGRPAAFRFLHVSTDEVYGSLGPDATPWTEQSPYAPNNPYAASKAASDHLVRAHHRTFGLPIVITHSSNNYGARQHPEKLIPTLAGQLLRGEPMTLHGDGTNIRDWLHVADHCQGLLQALRFGRVGEVYNFGGQCERTNLAIAGLVHAFFLTTPKPVIEFVGDRPGNDARYGNDPAKAMRELEWRPGADIGRRLPDALRWYAEHPDYAMEYGR